MRALIPLAEKFRPLLIELTSFKPKLLIRFIMNKTCKTNKHQYHVKIMHSEKLNKTRYDDPGKLMKQTDFTIKKT